MEDKMPMELISLFDNEEWKPYPKNADYLVSDLGRVRSLKHGKDRMLKPQYNQSGYKHYVLCWKDGRTKTMLLHKLVLETFVGPRPDGLVACHKDGDRENCRLDNLEYDTQSRNIRDRKKHGTERPPRGEINGMAKLKPDDVLTMYELRKNGLSHSKIAAQFGVSREQTRDIVNGKYWKHMKNAH